MDEPAVSYYMAASARKANPSSLNRMIHADVWPPKHEKARFYLQPEGRVSNTAPTVDSASLSCRFDPANPVPTMGGQNLSRDVGPKDQREIGERQDYLRFETPILNEDVAVAEHVEMELFFSTDALDTDFVVKLLDIYPNGYEADS